MTKPLTEQAIKVKIVGLLQEGPHTKKDIERILWLDSGQVAKCLSGLRQEGLVIRNDDKYELRKSVTQQDSPPRTKKKVGKPVSDAKSVRVIRVICTILAAGASVISVRNTFKYLILYYGAWGLLISTLMSLFMVVAFSMIVYFFKKGKWYIGALLAPLWLTVTVASMGSTVISMYNAQKDSFVERAQVTQQTSTRDKLYNEYTDQEKAIESLISDKKDTLKRYSDRIREYDTEEKRAENQKTYNGLSWNISQAEAYIATQTAKLLEIKAKKEALLTKVETQVIMAKSFEEEMGDLFHIPPALLQFIISIFYAIFIDIIAPFAASVAFFLRGE